MWEPEYMVSSFVVNDDKETGLENSKETLKDLDYTNEWMQTSVNGQIIIWKLLDLLVDGWKDNSSAPELLSLGSWGIHVLRDTHNTGRKCIDWELHKFLKNYLRKITWIKRYWTINGPFLNRKTFISIFIMKSKKKLLYHYCTGFPNHLYWKIPSES